MTNHQDYEGLSPLMKALNYLAAAAGIGTFLGFVNLLVGVFSAGWLAVQLYGYIKYELPHKKARRDAALHELAELRRRG